LTVVVLGQIGRDLVLRCDGLPASGGSAEIRERRELLGGKGANQAVGLTQLGVATALLGVAGDDEHGAWVRRSAEADGIDVAGVLCRGVTVLLVDIVDEAGSRRLFEDVPDSALLTVADLGTVGHLIDRAEAVSLQLQQPGATVLDAARRARRRGIPVYADGHPEAEMTDELLPLLDVLRLDAEEAELMAGQAVTDADAAQSLAGALLDRGVGVVAVAVSEGDLVVWRRGRHFVPHGDAPVLDRTGAGDAFMAGLIAALRDGARPREAGDLAGAAARSSVQRLGGRPDLGDLRS
jgi:ribokinase